jgi:predicted HicB family RNase H-like nuclease
MRRKVKKFQMRMHPDDHRRLMQLADLDRVGMAEWLQNKIRAEAKRRKLK